MNKRIAIMIAALLLAIGCSSTLPTIAPMVKPAPVKPSARSRMVGIQYYIVEDGTGRVVKNGFIACDNLLDGLEAVNVYLDRYHAEGLKVWPYIVIVEGKGVET